MLARLAARARFDSTVAANATAGVALPDVARAVEVMRTTSPRSYRDGSEGEFAGYRDALDHVVREAPGPLDVPLLAQLHRMLLRHTGDSGAGVPAGAEKQRRLAGLLGDYEEVIAEGRHPPLLPICALAHELVSMRPFERGSGRIARLLTTRELLRHGYRVAKYVSLEQRIFETLGSYEAVLAEDGEAPREDPHDLTPWARYLLGIVDGACDNLEHTIATGAQLAGATKRAQARDYILTQAPARFPLGQIDEALPDISKATIRDALEQLCAEGRVAVDRGPGAMWRLIA
ncbi:MAG TPA: Fic family protein [Solirubrobacteraceae bacterium]|nr:Fic family protein [Solirubrobacteraceae bacterium]